MRTDQTQLGDAVLIREGHDVRLCWPISQESDYESRPAALSSAVESLGMLRVCATEYHGRKRGLPDKVHRPLPSLLRLSHRDLNAVILSPLFLISELPNALWIDLYDDWSLAPEMRFPVRAMAREGYRRVRRTSAGVRVTVNSTYMRNKLAPANPVLVPNGLNPRICDSRPLTLDDTKRLILIGNFFKGRTDWQALAALLRSSANEEALVFGATEEIIRVAATINGERGRKIVRCFPKTPMREIAAYVGSRTVFGVPHVVSDYTMSQDIMKAYQAVALGCRVLMPLELVPAAISLDFVLTYGLGAPPGDVLRSAYAIEPFEESQRLQFVRENSWDARAHKIAELLDAN